MTLPTRLDAMMAEYDDSLATVWAEELDRGVMERTSVFSPPDSGPVSWYRWRPFWWIELKARLRQAARGFQHPWGED